MNILIKELSLQNLLSYGENITLPLNPLNILIGANGSGKSNLIEAIDLIHNAPGNLLNPIRDGGGVSEWIWKGQGASSKQACIETVFCRNSANERNIRYALAFSSVQQRFEIQDERIEDELPLLGHSDPYFYYHLNNGRPYLNVQDDQGGRRRELRSEDIDFSASILSQRRDADMYPELAWLGDRLSNICIYRDWNFGRYTAPRVPQRPDMPNKWLLPDCSNLGLVLSKLRNDTEAKKNIIDSLKALNPNIEDFNVLIEGGTVQIFVQESGMSISATRLSDGTLRLLCLLAVLCHPAPPPLICIEEPELGLHPDVIEIIAHLLKIASEKTQLIVTTHSSMLVDYFTDSPEMIVVSEKDANGTNLERLRKEDLKPWLEKYRLGKLWLSGEIGGVRW